MTAPKTFRKKPVEIQAVQWTGTDECADALYEWTIRESQDIAGSKVHVTQFMVLGEDDAYEVFRCYDEDLELVPGNDVERLIAEGFTATLYVVASGQWAHLRTNDWVIAEPDQGHYPCKREVFDATYVKVVQVEEDLSAYPDEYTDADYLNKVQG